jgi:hypothetical protein
MTSLEDRRNALAAELASIDGAISEANAAAEAERQADADGLRKKRDALIAERGKVGEQVRLMTTLWTNTRAGESERLRRAELDQLNVEYAAIIRAICGIDAAITAAEQRAADAKAQAKVLAILGGI